MKLLFLVATILLSLPGVSFTAYPQEDFTSGQGFIQADGVPHAAPSTEILDRIALCESSGNPLATNPNSTAKGKFQIIDGTRELVEKHTGKTYDLFNEEDSWEVALWLYERYGTKPWRASEICWNN